ncbi:retrovirus-related pol polyprotein from transposon TNT 1-94 [Tanacetum coccineum]
MNKLVKGNLVRGLPSKLFENDQTCVACQKGKQHRASCKSKTENSISHMDLFGPTFVKSLKKKMYCLVVIDDYSRFTWVFFLATKDETSDILKSFITRIENLVDHKVKVIRCDNGTEFKNREMNQFCEMKGILRQFSVARTPQQNRAAERRNMPLIEAARTMIPGSKTPTLSFMRPFGCPVTILNTIDHLGKFNGKADEGFFVGYSLNSKAFRVFNSRTRIVEENLHIKFSESTPNVVGQARKETEPVKNYILLPLWTADPPFSQGPKSSQDDGSKPSSYDGKKVDENPRKDSEGIDQEKEDDVNFVGYSLNSKAFRVFNSRTRIVEENLHIKFIESTPNVVGSGPDWLFDIDALTRTMNYEPIVAGTMNYEPTTRIYKDHPLDQVIEDLQSATQTRKMSNNLEEHRNKKDERGIVIRNKARLVAQGDTQEKGIDYDEVLAFVARIEAIMLFLAYALFKNFVVYQMDVISAFLYGKIKEEVYICQPLGFEDPDFPDRVYKVEKALYGLQQAPRAWYETLSTYLLDNGFQRGKINKALFIKGTKVIFCSP